MKQTLLLTSAFLCSLILFIGCANKDETVDRTDSNALYQDIKKMITLYTDSIAKAADSTSIAGIIERFEENLTKTNFKYPANADAKMTEGQQDTLYMLTSAFTKIKQKKLHQINTPRETPPDSTENDKD